MKQNHITEASLTIVWNLGHDFYTLTFQKNEIRSLLNPDVVNE